MKTEPFKPSRKADREKMARELREIARNYGAAFQAYTMLDDREINWRVYLNGIQIFGDIEPDMLGLQHWYCREGRLNSAAGYLANVNPFHRAKATSFPDTWTENKLFLERALSWIKDGTIFLERKDGTRLDPSEWRDTGPLGEPYPLD